MGNCKRCGALIGADYMFCGKCGEPVYGNQKEGKVIKAKRLRKLKRFEKKLSSSYVLNIIMTSAWAVISALWAFFFFGGCKDIRIASSGIGDSVGQLVSKYEYVKEGLSLSYISSEFSTVADYVISWSFTVFAALSAALGVILAVTYLLNFIGLKRGRKIPGVMKVRFLVSKLLLILTLLFIIILIIMFVMKGVI